MTVSSKRAYATCCVTQVCCSQSPCPHSRPLSHVSAGNTKHSKAGLAQSLEGSLGPSEHKVLSEPSKHLWWVWGLILNPVLPLLLFCWGFSFALGRGVSFFFGGIQHSPVDAGSAASCSFGVIAGEENSLRPYQAPRPTEGVPRFYSAHSLQPVSPVAGFPRTSSGGHSKMTAS